MAAKDDLQTSANQNGVAPDSNPIDHNSSHPSTPAPSLPTEVKINGNTAADTADVIATLQRELIEVAQKVKAMEQLWEAK